MPPSLLPSLAQVVRGLSALFWGLPIALLLGARSVLAEGWLPLPFGAPLAAHGLILFGLWRLRLFQPRERVWVRALDRAQIVAFLNATLALPASWSAHRPSEPFFFQSLLLLGFAAPVFLMLLNQVLVRLAAMLPDETNRIEARYFARLNIRVLWVIVLFLAALVAARIPVLRAGLPESLAVILGRIDPSHILMPALIPTALTMSLIWKAKESILTGVFRADR